MSFGSTLIKGEEILKKREDFNCVNVKIFWTHVLSGEFKNFNVIYRNRMTQVKNHF